MPWTNIANAQLAVGAPIRSVDLLALRDNITAQANGDAGAPKQQAAGINFNTNGLRNLSGALAIACPAFNTVGSYSLSNNIPFAGGQWVPGNILSGLVTVGVNSGGENINYTLSGSWRLMGDRIVCRVS